MKANIIGKMEMRKFIFRPFVLEVIFWVIALMLPLFINPSKPHFSICLFHNLGLNFCPGCGLGRSLALLYRGDIFQSFLCHPLGIFAFGVLLYRIIILSVKLKKTNYSL
jgi:hypothetical protein